MRNKVLKAQRFTRGSQTARDVSRICLQACLTAYLSTLPTQQTLVSLPFCF